MAINLNINLKTINGESITGTGNLVVNSINWRGELTNAPGTPIDYDAYHNLTDGNTYLYFDGRWQVFTAKGDKGDEGEGLTELEIGTPIDNSTAKSILYVDEDGNLGEITNFQYDATDDSLSFLNADNVGLLLNTDVEVDDNVFLNLNGIVKMDNGAPTAFVGVTDLSIFDPSFGDGVIINSDNQVFIRADDEIVMYSAGDISLTTEGSFGLGNNETFISLFNNATVSTQGRFIFNHRLSDNTVEYYMELLQHDTSVTDFTVYSAGSGVDTDTWDGYTIGQLFQAMKNMGFLA
ncbi:MAG: hypothetical protein LC105_04280 [Chitinophagales bacterium]|nr:hypothetical protein [Chitinophagales bacterium]